MYACRDNNLTDTTKNNTNTQTDAVTLIKIGGRFHLCDALKLSQLIRKCRGGFVFLSLELFNDSLFFIMFVADNFVWSGYIARNRWIFVLFSRMNHVKIVYFSFCKRFIDATSNGIIIFQTENFSLSRLSLHRISKLYSIDFGGELSSATKKKNKQTGTNVYICIYLISVLFLLLFSVIHSIFQFCLPLVLNFIFILFYFCLLLFACESEKKRNEFQFSAHTYARWCGGPCLDGITKIQLEKLAK